jgi:fatty-acyl-CoA synthase
MRIAMVGASPLPPGVRAAFEQATGVPLVEGYGLTEATCATVRGFPGASRAGMLGQRMPYQRVKAIRVEDDSSWTDLPAGETGILAIAGPTVFPGYVRERGADGSLLLDGLGTLRDGWLDTGDLGLVDADGWVRLAGRAKDLIIRGGHNIDPAVIEDALLAHPAVTAAGAVGQPDAHAGEVPVAYVTLAPGAVVDEAALVAWAREKISETAAAPRHVRVLPALPVTDVGKPSKLPLRADAARREAEAALARFPEVTAVEAEPQGGSARIIVRVTAGADEDKIREAMGAYALNWSLVPEDAPKVLG